MNRFRITALAVGLPALFYGLASLPSGLSDTIFAKGRIQSGHQDIACRDCHTKSRGTTRQQLQANARYLVGLRDNPTDIGYSKVTSAQCLSCHERPNERHPIYRFQEPRFHEARSKIEAASCIGCHSEHHDKKVYVDPGFCQACHDDLRLKADPVDVPHHEIIENQDWDSCLGCHDFHGNHRMKTKTIYRDRYATPVIQDYLGAGPSPYGDERHFEAKKQP